VGVRPLVMSQNAGEDQGRQSGYFSANHFSFPSPIGVLLYSVGLCEFLRGAKHKEEQ